MPDTPLTYQQAMQVIVSKAKETLSQPLYDSNDIAAATIGDTLYFNANTIGTVGLLRTNMELQGQLSQPRQFIAQQLAVVPWPTQAVAAASILTTLDASLIVAQSTITFVISDKFYLRGPSNLFPGGLGVDGYAAAGAGAAIEAAHSGVAHPSGRFQLKPGQLIKPTENFNIRLTIPVALAGLTKTTRVYVVLFGLQLRAVQ